MAGKIMLPCVLLCLCLSITPFCTLHAQKENNKNKKIPVLFDTDANNEIDDQHALAYLLFDKSHFDLKGITVNATTNGGDINMQYEEALRVLKLCGKDKTIPLLKGSNKGFADIQHATGGTTFDGSQAVHFIIEAVKKRGTGMLTLIAVGKLTNIALAVKKAPSIIPHIRLVWLGSNYPEAGEYNLDNDTAALNYLLRSAIHFEMVTVRYGQPSGTDAVRVTKQIIDATMPGLGPKVAPVKGRHDSAVTSFGDYSVNLFNHIEFYGTPPSRALFDMAAVAIVKNSSWAQKKEVPRPLYHNGKWVAQTKEKRKMILWENFDKTQILNDFFSVMKKAGQ